MAIIDLRRRARPVIPAESRSKRELVASAEAWLVHLRDDRRLARNTVIAYRSNLRVAFAPLPAPYTREDLTAALDRRFGPDTSPTVRRHSYVILGHFFAWWERQGGPANPLADMEPPARPNVRRRGLTEAEQEALEHRLRAAPAKEKAMALLMLREGFRVGDVAGLRFEDVDFAGGRVRCRDGKGGSSTWLPLSVTVALALEEWLAVTGGSAGPVFTGPNGSMSTRGIHKAWKRVCGPELKHLAPHQLRHTYATRLIRNGTDANTVRRLMRHASLAVTQLYIDEDPEAQRAAIDSLDRPAERLRQTQRARIEAPAPPAPALLASTEPPSPPRSAPAPGQRLEYRVSIEEVSLEEFGHRVEDWEPLRFCIPRLQAQVGWGRVAGWLARQLEKHPGNRSDVLRLIDTDYSGHYIPIIDDHEAWMTHLGYRSNVEFVSEPVTKQRLLQFAASQAGSPPSSATHPQRRRRIGAGEPQTWTPELVR